MQNHWQISFRSCHSFAWCFVTLSRCSVLRSWGYLCRYQCRPHCPSHLMHPVSTACRHAGASCTYSCTSSSHSRVHCLQLKQLCATNFAALECALPASRMCQLPLLQCTCWQCCGISSRGRGLVFMSAVQRSCVWFMAAALLAQKSFPTAPPPHREHTHAVRALSNLYHVELWFGACCGPTTLLLTLPVSFQRRLQVVYPVGTQTVCPIPPAEPCFQAI